ncbi:MAG: glutathione S-transferase N-terminal domain-containing protein [Myxococcales bacterium]|nr:glutathione S-transferase N-terminal domain-containing protein [Myxococcales bacterium]
MTNITVYLTRTCPYCIAAERYLHGRKLAYEAIDVAGDQPKRRWLVEQTGRTTVPQIKIGETWIGGYTDMMALVDTGELDRLLAS